MTENAVCTWDFTSYDFLDDHTKVIEKLNKCAKKWCFQLERGTESGKLHYQGRFSLKIKKRVKQTFEALDLPNTHLSPTSGENRDNEFYVNKDETREAGPWSDRDQPLYVPWDIRAITELLPWQQSLFTLSKELVLRQVYYLYDPDGSTGKSTFVRWMMVHGHGQMVPFCNDYRDVLRMIMDMPQNKCYLMDMPRAINKDKLQQLYSAIETVKGGYAYDDRYHFQQRIFDPPVVIVFGNVMPDLALLTRDRWRIFGIREDKSLGEYPLTGL